MIDFLESVLERIIVTGDAMIGAIASAITVVGVFQLVFVGVNVVIVLFTIYMRPLRTRKQVVMVLTSVLAAIAICCMTLYLYFQSLREVL